MAIQLTKHCDIPIRHHATEGDFFEENWGIVPSAIGRDPDFIRDLNLGRRPLRYCDFRFQAHGEGIEAGKLARAAKFHRHGQQHLSQGDDTSLVR